MRTCQSCHTEIAEEHRFCPGCGFPVGALRATSGDPLIGRTLGAGYVILEAVGAGGMGRVYRAEQASLGKTLAVKVIHPHLAGEESAVARFYAEARACSRLNHPNCVSVLDFGRTDDNLLFLVMEFLRGQDLARVVWEAGQLPFERAAEIIRQVLAALTEAHDQGIVHRDIKPENILVEPLRTGGDFVKMVDFGLAKIRSDDRPGVTSPGLVPGTPDFMAPEQARGLEPDPRSDLYSAAVVLFHCVTGRLPFESEDPRKVLLMHVGEAPPDPRTWAPELPESFVEVLFRGLEKDPEKRFQTGIDFAEALHAVVQGARSPTSDPPRQSDPGEPCDTCGALVAVGLKFCGECGARVGSLTAVPTVTATEPAMQHATVRPAKRTVTGGFETVLPFVGREAELSRMELARARATLGALVPLRVVGEEGSGRRSLVHTVVENARRTDTVVVVTGPDETWAGVPYAAVRRCVRELVGLRASQSPMAWLEQFVSDGHDVEPTERAGFTEVFDDDGAVELEPRARAEAAVSAVIFALRQGLQSRARTVFLVFEQIHRMDAASVRVLAGLLSRPVQLGVFLVFTHGPRMHVPWARGETLHLGGLPTETARAAIAAIYPNLDELPFATDEILPLHLDQLVRWNTEGGGTAPERMVDLIAARIERLPVHARRVLQALAILGEAICAEVAEVAGVTCDDSIVTMLSERGWLSIDRSRPAPRLKVSHPLVREVIDASTPATLRRELHRACMKVPGTDELPLEVRALHAEHGEDGFRSLLLLERVGDRALARGDDAAASQALRRGLEIARRELARGELDEPETAVVIFARKLGEALLLAGDAPEAEGVLREGLGLAARGTTEWARLEGALGRALFARGRRVEGLRSLDNASIVARRAGLRAVSVELLMSRAELETLDRAHGEAVTALTTAEAILRDLLRSAGATDLQRKRHAEVLYRLGRARRMAGLDGVGIIDEARSMAEALGARVILAQCDAELAEIAELTGDRKTAVSAWRRAVQNARNVGDASLEQQLDERLRRCSRFEQSP